MNYEKRLLVENLTPDLLRTSKIPDKYLSSAHIPIRPNLPSDSDCPYAVDLGGNRLKKSSIIVIVSSDDSLFGTLFPSLRTRRRGGYISIYPQDYDYTVAGRIADFIHLTANVAVPKEQRFEPTPPFLKGVGTRIPLEKMPTQAQISHMIGALGRLVSDKGLARREESWAWYDNPPIRKVLESGFTRRNLSGWIGYRMQEAGLV